MNNIMRCASPYLLTIMVFISIASFAMDKPNGRSEKIPTELSVQTLSALEKFAKTYRYPLERLYQLINGGNLSALNHAALEGNITLVDELLHKCEPLDSTLGNDAKDGLTALGLAFMADHFEIVNLISKKRCLNDANALDLLFIWQSLAQGDDNETTLARLLQSGFSPNFHVVTDPHYCMVLEPPARLTAGPSTYSTTLLKVLIEKNHIRQIALLLKTEVNLDEKLAGNKASYLQCARDSSQITRLLLAAGAVPSEQDIIYIFNDDTGSEFITEDVIKELDAVMYYYLLYGQVISFPFWRQQAFARFGSEKLNKVAAAGELEKVKELLNGAVTSESLGHALAFAAGRKKQGIVALLLARDAPRDLAFEVIAGILLRSSLSQTARDEYSAIRELLRAGDRKAMQVFVQTPSNANSLLALLPTELLPMIMGFIDGQSHFERQHNNLELAVAVDNGNEERAQDALTAGADPHVVNRHNTPLWQIMLNSAVDSSALSRIITLLQKYGWTAHQPNADNHSLVTYLHNNPELIERRIPIIQKLICSLIAPEQKLSPRN